MDKETREKSLKAIKEADYAIVITDKSIAINGGLEEVVKMIGGLFASLNEDFNAKKIFNEAMKISKNVWLGLEKHDIKKRNIS